MVNTGSEDDGGGEEGREREGGGGTLLPAHVTSVFLVSYLEPRALPFFESE